jgi:hypothetical protein
MLHSLPAVSYTGKISFLFKSAGLLIMILILSGACTRTVYVPMLKPAAVDVGPHIRTIAIVDRSTPENPAVRVAENILTGTMPGLNREAAQRSIEGLVRTLEDSPRYNVIRTAERLTSPALPGNWPPPLSWGEVGSLAAEYNSDAILVLESFDSDFIVTNGSRTVKRTVEGKEVDRREYYAEGIAGIKLGFRLYDLRLRAISDEYMFNHNGRWEVTGNALQMIVGGLIDHRQAVNDASFQSGIIYADRISPQWLRLNRDFFTKGRGNTAFKIGVRRATVNDWAGARESWQESVRARRKKTAGRSAYNLALMYEIEGDLLKAREWAQRSYTDYGIKKARQYVSALERRIRQERVTDAQMM